MKTIQPTIYRQRVLPAKITQQMLPPITADATPIHKMIEEKYGKTVILPETHSYHETNYDANESKEMIDLYLNQNQNQIQIQNPPPPTFLKPKPTLIQPPSFYQPQPQPVVVTFKPVIYRSINPNIIIRKHNLFQPILPVNIPMPIQHNQILISRNAPILSSINLPYSSFTY